MHEVAVLALPSVVAFELGLPHKLIGGAVDEAGKPLYRVRVATVDGGPVRTSAGYSVLPEHDASILRTADTVVVPGIQRGAAVERGGLEDAVCAALDGLHARLMSICTGAFVLAAARRLDGRPATTHWMHTAKFQQFFPAVRLDPDVLYVDDGDVLTSAGNAAGIDLCLHLVRRDHGADVANRVARRMVVAAHRDGGQAQFIDLPVPARPADDPIAAAMDWALGRLPERVAVEDMARRAHLSPRQFSRRFRGATGASPAAWLLRRRLDAALPLLESSDEPVEQVGARVGFPTPAAFRRHFARAYGVPPSRWRRTFAER
jgi:transcriptional regulator GlxA family with amidase domain